MRAPREEHVLRLSSNLVFAVNFARHRPLTTRKREWNYEPEGHFKFKNHIISLIIWSDKMIYDLIKATCFFPGILFSVQELLFYLEKFDIVTKKKSQRMLKCQCYNVCIFSNVYICIEVTWLFLYMKMGKECILFWIYNWIFYHEHTFIKPTVCYTTIYLGILRWWTFKF